MLPLEEFREKLLAQRRALLERIGRVEDDLVSLQEEIEIELGERAQEDTISNLLRGLDERSREELLAINAALERIIRGDYGRCEVCGDPIPRARLEALPTATTHVECAEGRRPAAT